MTSDEIREFAANLKQLADSFDERLKDEQGNLSPSDFAARMQEEQRLRSLSSQLWLEAADLDLSAVDESLDEVADAVESANQQLEAITNLQDAIELVADVLVLAGAVAAGKPAPVVAALKEVQATIQSLPPKP